MTDRLRNGLFWNARTRRLPAGATGMAIALWFCPSLYAAGHAQSDENPPELSPVAVTAYVESNKHVELNLSEVLTPEQWRKVPDRNAAEILGRASGFTVLKGGYGHTNGVHVDLAGRGEGNFVSIRGLDSEFNLNLVNGVQVAQARPFSRAIQLNLLPPTGLHGVVINKTLTSAMDGQAIGGAVDFRTPTAFDFTSPRTAQLEVMTQAETRALQYREPGLGGRLAATVSRRYNEFGVYAAAYYSHRSFANQIIDGVYPAAINGAYAFDPALGPASLDSLVLTGVNVGISTGDATLAGGNLSFDWLPRQDARIYVRAAHARSRINQGTSYLQIYGEEISHGSEPTPFTIGSFRPRYYYETNPESAAVTTLQAGAEWGRNALHLFPRLSVSMARNDAPDDIEISGRINQASTGFPFGQARLFDYTGGIPSARLTPLQQTMTSNVKAYDARRSGQLTVEHSSQARIGAELDARYVVDRAGITALYFGAKLTRSDRKHTNRNYTTGFLAPPGGGGPSLGSLGILHDGVTAVGPGVYAMPVPLVDEKELFDVFYSAIDREFGSLAAASDQCGPIFENSHNCDTQQGREMTAAAYAGSRWSLGDLQVDLGFRYEGTRIWNRFWVMARADGGDLPGAFARNRSRYDKLLPNLQFMYQPTDQATYRLQWWKSYVLPSAFQLGGGAQVSSSGGGAANGGTTTITQGNPDLSAIDASNVDLSAAWKRPAVEMQVSAFHKSLRNYIFSTVRGYTGAVRQTNRNTIIITPRNGGSATVNGMEVSAKAALRPLWARLAGVGLSGNLTLARSRVDTGLQGLDRDERLLNQPGFLFNGQVTWETGPYHAALSYRYISDYVSQYGTLGPRSDYNTWVRSSSQFDLVAGWRSQGRIEVSLQAANLLGHAAYRAGIGRNSGTVPSIVDAGRSLAMHIHVRY